MTTVVLVHDEKCGVCSDVALRLAEILAASVTVRSCRDPHLADELPLLRPHLVDGPCRRPLAVITREDGRPRVIGGLLLFARLGPLVKASRWPAAVRLSVRVAGRRLVQSQP